jgi:pimeloyl-ACP methyl ester carboxylesterase
MPKGIGPFPAVLFIPKDGPVTNGEQMLLAAYGSALAEAGYIMMVFDNPGQGKSQGDILDLDGTKQLTNIEAALAMLRSDPSVKKDFIALIGHKGGGYLALEAARAAKGVLCCAVLELPAESEKDETFQKNYRDKIQNALNENGLGTFDNSYMDNAAFNLGKHVSGVQASTDDFMYFLGTKLPAAAYKQYLGRKVYRSVLNVNKPVLLVFGKNDPDISPQAIEALKRSAAQGDLRIKIAVFNDLDPYMGKLLAQDNGWVFTPDHDVINSILEWLGDNLVMTPLGASQNAASAASSDTK